MVHYWFSNRLKIKTSKFWFIYDSIKRTSIFFWLKIWWTWKSRNEKNVHCVYLQDTNFWGAVYTTYFAIPHLKRSQGKIIALSSSAEWMPDPRMSMYHVSYHKFYICSVIHLCDIYEDPDLLIMNACWSQASKAAVLTFFETLRIELAPYVHVLIATPGFIESEITTGKFLSGEGRMEVDQDLRDVSHFLLYSLMFFHLCHLFWLIIHNTQYTSRNCKWSLISKHMVGVNRLKWV